MTPAQELVLDCYRSPHLLRSLSDHSIPLPEGVGRLVRAALGDEPMELDPSEPTTLDELRRATLLYVKRVVLVDGGDYYRSLGVRADASAEQIDFNYRGLLALLQADEEESTSSLCDYVLRVSKAYSIVGDSVRRRMYDRTRLTLLDNDELDIPVDAVVDEVLSTSRRPTEPIESTAHVESDWSKFASPAAPTAVPEPPPAETSVDQAEPATIEIAEAVPPPRKVSDQVLIGVSLAAIAVIALVTPMLIARYSILVPQWQQPVDMRGATLPTNPLVSVPQQGQPSEATSTVLALGESAPLGQVPLDQSEAVYSSEPFEPGEPEPEVSDAVSVDVPPAAKDVANEEPKSAPPVVVAAPVVVAPTKTVALPVVPMPTMPAPSAAPSVASVTPTDATTEVAADVATPPAASAPQLASEPVAVVLTEPEPSSPPPVAVFPAELIIPRNDLSRLVERLEATYQDGDIFQFSGLFAADARTNDRVDRVGIREDYEQLFSSTETRQFSLSNMKWRYEGERAIGTGDFTVRIKPRWKNRDEVFSGRMEMRVQREGDSLVISEMYHDYK